MSRFSTDGLVIDSVTDSGMSAALKLRGVGSASHNLGIQTIGPDSGNPYDEAKFIGAQQVTMPFTITAISTLLGEVALLSGLCVKTGTDPGAILYGQTHDPCGTAGRASGSVNMSVTADKAHVFIQSISGSRGSSATVNLLIVALSEAGLAPTAVAYNAALPTLTVLDEEFSIAHVDVAGQVLDPSSIQSWTIDTGIEFTQLSAVDEIWATDVDITKIRPRVTIQTDDPSILDSGKIEYTGTACTHANTELWLRERTPSGGLTPKATTNHIKFTAAGIAYVNQHYDASGSATGNTEIAIETITSGGSAPVVATTGLAIT